MKTESFYANLPILDNFLEITNSDNFHSVPSDWHVVITDIISSTKAIEEGRYKQVNLLGASSIAAVLNIASEIEIPFVFGGDGATLLIPTFITYLKDAFSYHLQNPTGQIQLGTFQRSYHCCNRL